MLSKMLRSGTSADGFIHEPPHWSSCIPSTASHDRCELATSYAHAASIRAATATSTPTAAAANASTARLAASVASTASIAATEAAAIATTAAG